MRRSFIFFLLFTLHSSLFTLSVSEADAQYYSWGPSPASVKWNKLNNKSVKLIYPRDFEENARRVMWYLDSVRNHIDFGYRHGTMRTPVVIHTRNMIGNGMAMWAPKRMELLAAPGASYSEPWLKQLAIHEYRHNVQFNNLRRSTNRVLTWFLGEQIAFLGNIQFSMTAIEGDAVMAETELSAFGRGLQPSWTMHYRAMGDVGTKNHSGDYWFSGSFRDYVPDHYRLGYQMVRWSYDHFDKFIWDDIARYVARNPQFIFPMDVGIKKLYDITETELFRRTFADLNAHWDSLPRVEDSSERVVTRETSYTTYQWPLWLNDTTLVAFKSDFDRYNRIVRVDAATGDEKILAYTGAVSSRPVLSADGVLWWTEYRSSLLWDEKVNSRLCSYDFATGRKAVHHYREQMFYPTLLPDGGMAHVSYDYSGRFSIVQGGSRLDFPLDIEITGLARDDVTERLYFIGLDDGGMFLGAVSNDYELRITNYERLTTSKHISISDLRAAGGKLYFGSIVSGKDEAHCYDLATGTEYRLSESKFGSFQPSPSQDGLRIAQTTYDRHGYHLAVQNAAGAVEQEQRTLPVDLVNPQWKRWNVPKMDSLVYTATEVEKSETELRPKKFRKAFNLFRPHSWLPVNFYPPAAIQEMDITMSLGATVMSQSLLSDATTWLAYGWKPGAGSMLRGGFSYGGLGPVLDVDFTWGGGPQICYSDIPESLGINLKPYFSVSTRLSLPMTVSSGYWYSFLSPSAAYFYTNGLLFIPHTGELEGTLTRGVEQVSVGVGYSGQTRMTQKELLPRWGFGAKVAFVTNPTNRDVYNILSASMHAYLPGVVRPHSTTIRLAWHESVGGGKSLYMFRMKEVFPRGAMYDFTPKSWASGSVDYQFPVWYPEAGWPGVIYFKRLRLNVFADYAQWQSIQDGKWRPLWSYGGDIILDMSPVRIPGTTHVSLKFTVAKPSDRKGVFWGFGFEVPL